MSEKPNPALLTAQLVSVSIIIISWADGTVAAVMTLRDTFHLQGKMPAESLCFRNISISDHRGIAGGA
jgi:hypothetical protein